MAGIGLRSQKSRGGSTFENFQNDNFRLKPTSPAFKLGFHEALLVTINVIQNKNRNDILLRNLRGTLLIDDTILNDKQTVTG
jgi:hypothetical protein